MAYDPENDDATKCTCDPDAVSDEYPDGWDEYFKSVLVPMALAEMTVDGLSGDGTCPRTLIRHLIAKLAVAIAAVSHPRNTSDSQQSVESLLRDVPGMLSEMVGDARPILDSALFDEREERRGSAAGFRKLN